MPLRQWRQFVHVCMICCVCSRGSPLLLIVESWTSAVQLSAHRNARASLQQHLCVRYAPAAFTGQQW